MEEIGEMLVDLLRIAFVIVCIMLMGLAGAAIYAAGRWLLA